MSRELIFYPAFKDKQTNTYKPLLYDVDMTPACIFWRSRSFIDTEFFSNFPMAYNSEFDFAFDFLKRIDGDKELPSYVYVLTLSDLINSANHGIVSGYFPIEEVNNYYNSDSPQEYLTWEMSTPIQPEVFIELPDEEKKKYMKFYAIDTYSSGYVCSYLLEVLNDMYIPDTWEGDVCVLIEDSF